MKEPECLTNEELRELARNVVTNVTFITNDTHVIESAFMVALLIDWSEWDLTKVGAFYEDHARRTGTFGVNGYPCFFSCKLLHVDDLDPLILLMNEMTEALR